MEETRDWWIIRDSIAGRPGVFNNALRPEEELRRSYGTLEGKPIIINHPPDDDVHHELLAIYPGEIHGVVRNARWDAKERAIVYDAYLLRRADVPGHESTPEIIAFNTQMVAALQDGVAIDNSPGYLTRVTREPGVWNGQSYSETRRDFGYWHLAIVPQGACGWDDHCGLGRAQDKKQGEPDMANPPPAQPKLEDLAAEIDRLKKCADKAEENEKTTKKELDALRTKNLELEKLLQKPRGDAGGGGTPPAPAPQPDPAVDALRKQLDELQAEQKRAADERKKEVDMRLARKRTKLLELRGAKGDAAMKALEAYPESALDDAIQREESLRAHGDGIQFGLDAAAGGAGLAAPTVGRWDSKKGDWTSEVA